MRITCHAHDVCVRMCVARFTSHQSSEENETILYVSFQPHSPADAAHTHTHIPPPDPFTKTRTHTTHTSLLPETPHTSWPMGNVKLGPLFLQSLSLTTLTDDAERFPRKFRRQLVNITLPAYDQAATCAQTSTACTQRSSNSVPVVYRRMRNACFVGADKRTTLHCPHHSQRRMHFSRRVK